MKRDETKRSALKSNRSLISQRARNAISRTTGHAAGRDASRRNHSDDAKIIAEIGVLADRLLRQCPSDTATRKPGERRATRQHPPLLEQAIAAAAQVEERIAEQKARIAYLETLSQTDELTGLLNRRGFLEHLRHALAAARRYGDSGVLVFCDLDNFKAINDTHGHAFGDAVLQRIAEVVKEGVRETDAVARLGGDEFAVLMTQTSWRNGYKRAKALDRALSHGPLLVRRKRVAVEASFGIEPYGPDDEESGLIARADMAMYCNKRKKASAGFIAAAE